MGAVFAMLDMKVGWFREDMPAAWHLQHEHERTGEGQPRGPLPEWVAAADYDDAIARVIERASPSMEGVSLYDFGQVSCTGISDIDLLFVVPDQAGAAQCQALIDACKGERHFFHGPLIATVAVARKLGWIFPRVAIRHLSGSNEVAHIEHPDAAALREVSLSDVLEAALARWFWLRLFLAEPLLNERRALLGMWALRRSILYKQMAGPDLTDRERLFCETLLGIRSQWSHAGLLDSSAIAAMLIDAPAMAEGLIREIGSLAVERYGRGARNDRMSGGRVTLRRCARGSLAVQRCGMRFGARRRLHHVIDVPSDVFDFLSKLHAPCPASLGMPPPLVTRQKLVDEYRSFLAARGLSGAAAPPGILAHRSSHWLPALTDRAISAIASAGVGRHGKRPFA